MKSRINHAHDWELAEESIKSKSERKAERSKRGGKSSRVEELSNWKKPGSSNGVRKHKTGASERELTPGTVIAAHVNYADESGGWKTRPAVVLEVRLRTVYVLPITSASHRDRYPGVEVVPGVSNGLSRVSRVQSRIVEIDRLVDVVDILGRLDNRSLGSSEVMYLHLKNEHTEVVDNCVICVTDAAKIELDEQLREEIARAREIPVTPMRASLAAKSFIPNPAVVAGWMKAGVNKPEIKIDPSVE